MLPLPLQRQKKNAMVTKAEKHIHPISAWLRAMGLEDMNDHNLMCYAEILQHIDQAIKALETERAKQEKGKEPARCRICGILLDPQNPGSLCDGCMDDKERRYNEKMTL